jgi:cytochrome P450
MSLSTYYLLSNPDKLEKLRQEIQTVQPNDEGLLEFAALRTLPYLTAVIKESLRMSSPVPGVIPRCVPEGGMTWAGHFLPAGVSQRSCPKRMSTSSDSGIDFRFHLHPDGAR